MVLRVSVITIKFSKLSVRNEFQGDGNVDLPQYRILPCKFAGGRLSLSLSLPCSRREGKRYPFITEIQNTSLELNVRGWTPGVEPCAETKSSRHCHLGRDARVFTPAGEFPFYVYSSVPTISRPISLPILTNLPRREATFNVHPSRATLQTLRPAYPRTTRRFFYQFIFPFIVRL